MKYTCLVLLLLTGFSGFSQNKRTYYFDENWQPTTETAFRKIEKEVSQITRYYDMDTAYIAKVYLFENYGKLDNKTFSKVKEHLELLGKAIDTTKLIVINYVSDVNDNSVTSEAEPYIYDISDWKELKKLKKISDINLIWLQYPGNKPQIRRYNKKIDWVFDQDDFIAKTFLEYNCPIGSLILLKPDGNYLAFYCFERAKNHINELIEKFKKTS